mmetsp:Transcript_118098/g.216431  ORF Transcript_118098/g.216431 Transcript_118098/m.216431 type:complete len:141 (+) Transcript_118098:443-865(+)
MLGGSVTVACTTTEPEDSCTETWSLVMPAPDWSATDSLIASLTLLIMFGLDANCWYKIPFILKFTSMALSAAVVLVEVLVVVVEVLLTNVVVVEVLLTPVVVVGHASSLQLKDSDKDVQSSPERSRVCIPPPQVFEHAVH